MDESVDDSDTSGGDADMPLSTLKSSGVPEGSTCVTKH